MFIELRICGGAPSGSHPRIPGRHWKSAVHPTYADAAVPKRPIEITVWTEKPIACERLRPCRYILSFDGGPSLPSRARVRPCKDPAHGPCDTGATLGRPKSASALPLAGCSI